MKASLFAFVVLFSTSVFAVCPDVSGKYKGKCIERNCQYSREVQYLLAIKQNKCESVKLGFHFAGEYTVGVPQDKGNDLNTSQVRTLVTYFGNSLLITEIFGSDLSKPALVAVQSLNKEMVGGSEVLNVKYELSGAQCGNVTMECQLEKIP